MACILKCNYDYKINRFKRLFMGRKTIETMFVPKVEEMIREDFGL